MAVISCEINTDTRTFKAYVDGKELSNYSDFSLGTYLYEGYDGEPSHRYFFVSQSYKNDNGVHVYENINFDQDEESKIDLFASKSDKWSIGKFLSSIFKKPQ